MYQIKFQPLTLKDIPLVHRWFNTAHVRKFYSLRNWTEIEVLEKLTPYITNQKPIFAFIFFNYELPVGYIQYYRIIDFPWPNQNLADEIIQSGAGLDLFIGEPHLLNQGLGTVILNEALKQLIFPKFQYCVVDRDIKNLAMIRCNEESGFKFHKIIHTEDALNRPQSLKLMIKERNNF